MKRVGTESRGIITSGLDNMKLEEQVTSVALSNKLRKLLDDINVQKPSLFYRDWTGAKEDEVMMWGNEPDWCEDNIPCYTASELGEMLPSSGIEYHKTIDITGKWSCGQSYPSMIIIKDDNEANVRARMLIYLLENKLSHLK